MIRIALMIAALIAAALPLSAQCPCSTDLTGRVTGTDGRSVRRALVTVTGCVTLQCDATETRSIFTNTFGFYHFSRLVPLDQVLQVWAKGYHPFAAVIPLYLTSTANVQLEKQTYELHTFDPKTDASLPQSFGISASESRYEFRRH